MSRSQRSRKPLILGGAVVVLLMVAGAGFYAYWTGMIGDRPGSIAREITAEIQQSGFDAVTVSMNEDWVASAVGSVVGQDQRRALEEILRGRSEIRDLNLAALQVQPSIDEELGDDRVVNGLTLAGALKVMVSEYGGTYGRFPDDSHHIELDERSALILEKEHDGVRLSLQPRGEILISYPRSYLGLQDGPQVVHMRLIPSLSDNWDVIWRCRAEAIPERLVPLPCRP